MKKAVSLFTIFIMLLSLLTLTGCHGSRGLPEFEMPEEFDTSRNFELTFWAKNDTNATQIEIYNKAIADFHELYPNITVTMRPYTDYVRIYNDVITNISTNTTPNICVTYPDHIATYITGTNVVVPLDELFSDEKYGLGGSELRFDSPAADEIVPQFLNECIVNGSCYAVPYMRSTEACYVNKTYVEALGYTLPDVLTWDFIWEVSEAAMAKNADGTYKVNGQEIMIPFIYKSTDNMMIQQLRQLGGEYITEKGDVLIFNDTTRSILGTVAEHVATGAFSTFKISSYPANFFNAGQCIFGIDSTAGATWMGSNAPLLDISADQLVDFETVVMALPQFDTQNPQMISQGPSLCVFNKDDPQEVLASWLFTQYMLSNDVQIAYSQTEGYVPVTLKAQQSEEYQSYLSLRGSDNGTHYYVKIDASKLLIDNAANTFTTPVFNGSASVREVAGQMIENVAKSVRRGQNADDEYIDALFDDMVSLYHLDQIDTAGNVAKEDLGPLPTTAVTLLAVLAAVWVFIGIFFGYRLLKSKHSR